MLRRCWDLTGNHANPAPVCRWCGKGGGIILQPGPGEGVIRVTDASGKTRDVILDGDSVVLDQGLMVKPRRLQLSVVDGSVSIDDIKVQ